MSKLGNYLHPDMTQAQIDFWTQHLKDLPSWKLNEYRRKALMSCRRWKAYTQQKVSQSEATRHTINYLHRVNSKVSCNA